MEGVEAVFGDRRCNFKMNFWNNALVKRLEGIEIKFTDIYSKRNMRFYRSRKPINQDVGSIQPNRGEVEKYRFDPKRDRLKQGDHLFVINMGNKVGRFMLGGRQRPLPNRPNLTPDWQAKIDPTNFNEPEPTLSSDQSDEGGISMGVIVVFIVVGVIVLLAVVFIVIRLARKN